MKKSERLKVAVIFGGCSSEYGVSLHSAAAVIRGLDAQRYEAVLVGISREGEWFYYSGSAARIEDDTWRESDCTPAVIAPSRSVHGLWVLRETGVETIHLDVVFPVLHGRNGEDGTVQGAVALAGIPLAGCGVLASALCMDKERAHRLAEAAGVRVPKSFVLRQAEDEKQAVDFAREIGFPVFVKPVKAGSSYGISRVCSADGLQEALAEAAFYDDEVLIEEEIAGFEVGCAVLGTEELLTGEVDEIELTGGFFDFTEKYTLKSSAIHVPARISEEKSLEIKETAKRIYQALGCSGFARVDLFLTNSGELVFNEVNTIPGFTAHSRYPGMMQAAGISFPELIDRIIRQAVEV